MYDLRGKKVLFITPKFFGYENKLKCELELAGAFVDMYDERLDSNFFDQVMLRLHLFSLLNRRIRKYFSNIFEKTSKVEYDYVWINNPEALNEEMLKVLKVQQKKAKFLLYMWDNFENKVSVPKLLPYFDKIASFDKSDCQKYNLVFLPLFVIREYREAPTVNEILYDISFVATAHSDRAKIVQDLKLKCEDQKLKTYFYLFLPNKITFYGMKVLERAYKGVKKSTISFDPLSHDQIITIGNRSKSILDIQHPSQTGLTMRTIEVALGMRKKLITTNSDIVKYDFYNSNNIYVIDRDNVTIEAEFLNSSYTELNKEIYDKYSIENWITTFFSEGGNDESFIINPSV